jgi:hypothetical protein
MSEADRLAHLIERTGEFHGAFSQAIENLPPHPGARFAVAYQSALLSLEHAEGALILISQGLHAPGFALARPQYESLVRGIWCLYCATDEWIGKLGAELTPAAQRAANSGVAVPDMLRHLESQERPDIRAIVAQLQAFKGMAYTQLNSFVHAGIHPLSRVRTGYPPQLVYDFLRNSNGLVTLGAQLLAILSGRSAGAAGLMALFSQFEDCLPISRPNA